MNLKLIVSILTLFICFSCASTKQYVKNTNETTLSPDKARIYILRPSSLGGSIRMRVFSNESLIGQTGPKSYLCWDVEEGKHEIKTNAENKEKFYINASKGQVYYIKQTPKMGITHAKVELEQISEEEGKKILKNLKNPKLNYAE